MALYPGAVLKLIPPDRNDPPIRVRMVILHVAVSNGDSLYGMFLNNQRDGGSKVESHFYVRFDGTVEQYRDTAYQADANTMANDFAMSIETAGMGDGAWTAAQLASLKSLIQWAHNVHGVPYRVPTTWNDPVGGVGWHNLFATQWAGGPRACPGPDRIGQIRNILIPWMASGAPMPSAPGSASAGRPIPVPQEGDMVPVKISVAGKVTAWVDTHGIHAASTGEQGASMDRWIACLKQDANGKVSVDYSAAAKLTPEDITNVNIVMGLVR